MINKKGPISLSQGGFTLIETLLAVFLMSLAITGPLTIASKGLNATLVAKDQIIAFYLAQDGMEQVRFLRDSACLTAGAQVGGCPSATWLSSLTECQSAKGCYLDSLGNNPSAATACDAISGCRVMSFDKRYGYYNYNDPLSDPANIIKTPQNYIRTITITPNPGGSSPDEVVVTVTVSWSDLAGVTHAPITLRENLLLWQ